MTDLDFTILIRIQEMADDIREMCEMDFPRHKIIDNVEQAQYLIHAYTRSEHLQIQFYMNEFYRRFFQQDKRKINGVTKLW